MKTSIGPGNSFPITSNSCESLCKDVGPFLFGMVEGPLKWVRTMRSADHHEWYVQNYGRPNQGSGMWTIAIYGCINRYTNIHHCINNTYIYLLCIHIVAHMSLTWLIPWQAWILHVYIYIYMYMYIYTRIGHPQQYTAPSACQVIHGYLTRGYGLIQDF